MKAIFNPETHEKLSTKLIEKQGLICEWEYVYTIDSVDYYITNDKVFFNSNPFPITDLEIIK